MTYREIELWIEGQNEARTWLLEALAWTQANLINIHIPRGKPKTRPDQLLPKRRRRSSDDETVKQQLDEELSPLQDPKARLEEMKRRARERMRDKEFEDWKKSKEAAKILGILEGD